MGVYSIDEADAGRTGTSHPASVLRRCRAAAAATMETALDLVLPRICPGCSAPTSWCDACADTLAGRPRAVEVPAPVLDLWAADGFVAPPVHALARYTGPVRAAIIAGKERGRRDLPAPLGRALGRGIATLQDAGVIDRAVWLVPAPTRRSSARARGGDPVAAMARSAAAVLAARGRPTGVAPCLFLARGTRDSVGLDAVGRAANMAGSIRCDRRALPPSRSSVVLLDDVFTSGATVAASCRALDALSMTVSGVMVLAAVPHLRPEMLVGAGARG